jgi:hypothetical protein
MNMRILGVFSETSCLPLWKITVNEEIRRPPQTLITMNEAVTFVWLLSGSVRFERKAAVLARAEDCSLSRSKLDSPTKIARARLTPVWAPNVLCAERC